ncbi:RlpA-like double-psi beta-barrel domain-containing protein [Streptomyces pulveraceus]|uniref:RlpA-like double-psi beta-barrel domain-containing protein n=1 Tax=Streptomyces pulveraceus TaxID=68258 RepID=A0ABW1GFA1_9ACTN
MPRIRAVRNMTFREGTLRAKRAKIAAAALLAVGCAAVITVANASASDDVDFPIPASSGTGQPLEPDPILSGTPGSAPAPEPSVTTTPPPEAGRTTMPDPEQSGSVPPEEPSRTSAPPSEGGRPAEQPPRSYSGSASYYQAGLGACGQIFTNGDFVVALDSTMFGAGYPAPNCGRKVVVTYQGKSITATVLDESPVSGRYGIDLTPAAFRALAPLDQAKIDVTWRFAE